MNCRPECEIALRSRVDVARVFTGRDVERRADQSLSLTIFEEHLARPDDPPLDAVLNADNAKLDAARPSPLGI